MTSQPLVFAPIAALLVGFVAIATLKRIAPVLGFVDCPDRRRKLHEIPVALGGGIAVWLAAWTGWGVGMIALTAGGAIGSDLAWTYSALAVSSLLVLALGIADDRYGMRGSHKLVGQLLVAIFMVASGTRIDTLQSFGVVVDLGIFGFPITVFWIVLVVNAFNLIDGMDGFCGGVSFMVAIGLAVMFAGSQQMADAFLALAIAGALVAFLKDNLPPARIYLGDAGSMTLGLLFSVLSLRACSTSPGGPIVSLPLIALLLVPLLDVVMALGRRWLTGQSLFMPDRGHIHHRLRARVGSVGTATAVAAGLAAIGSGGAVLTRVSSIGDGISVLATILPVVLLVGTRSFGGSELRLLAFRLQRISTRLLATRSLGEGTTHHECRLHGGRDWAVVWDDLIGAVEHGEVRRIELAIDMPAVGETYHGVWSLTSGSHGLPNWSVVHSIYVGGVYAGELRAAGGVEVSRGRYLDKVEEIVRILEGHLEEDAADSASLTSEVSARALGRAVLRGQEV